MMVRTYGRRNRGISLNDGVHDSLSEENDNDNNNRLSSLPFSSSQDSSSHWSFEFDPYDLDSSQASFDDDVVHKQKRPRVSSSPPRKRGFSSETLPVTAAKGFGPSIPATSTLMEAQEFGEMMEHVDEVNFALDGLRKNQPVRIRRASLLSLLSICATQQQRRHLRTQGMAKTIVDAVLGLSFDDSPSNLAAVALLYVLTCEGQDDHLLESPNCIRFLIRLLKPISSTAPEEKLPKIGSKLLALRTGADGLLNTNKRVDSSSAAIVSKVHELLVSCKELKPSQGNGGAERPELCPKWIALLTMERACLSTISLEESSGTVRKSGVNFKEKLRELGGLDAVFEVAMKCNSDMESWMEVNQSFARGAARGAKVDIDLQCLSLLLKCLKIMENATFLSKDNQNHLLVMKRRMVSTAAPISFTALVINVIKILSDISLLKASTNEKSSTQSDGTNPAMQLALIADSKGYVDEDLFSDSSKSNMEKIYAENNFDIWQNGRFVAASQFDFPSSETTSTSMSESYSLKTRLRSSASTPCSGSARSLSGSMLAPKHRPRKSPDRVQKLHNLDLLEESQDPFAFDEDDMEPSKWEVLSGKKTVSGAKTKRSELIDKELDNGFDSQMLMSQEETSNGRNDNSHEASCSTPVDEESSSLLADCLLTAVKALMNVTNDNTVGCRQIASCGGLETMSSLIACHFPSFSSSPLASNKLNSLFVDLDAPDDRPLTDHELDFLVAILGLLVNLVEKDSENRSRLASTSVQLRNSDSYEDMSNKDVIPLLCSIFLANQGAGEAVQDGKATPSDEEAVLEGEKEAEKMILEAYAALLLAFLSTESKSIREAIADCLPDRNLGVVVPVLERFVAFHLSLNMISPETHKAVSEVIESCRTKR